MWTLLMIGVGVLIGWNFPQPEYAKQFQAWATTKVKDLWAKYVAGPR